MNARSLRGARAAVLLTALLACAGSRGSELEKVEPFASGQPLAHWIAQADHFVPEMRRQAVEIIASLGPAGAPAVPVLRRAALDADSLTRVWALEALRRIGPAAAPALPTIHLVFRQHGRSWQVRARGVLAAIGPKALPGVREALAASDPWIRANAAELLGIIAPDQGRTARLLEPLLADEDPLVRSSAAWALGQMGPRAAPATKAIARALAAERTVSPRYDLVRQREPVTHLVGAAGAIGPKARDAIPEVVAVLREGNGALQVAAVEALVKIGQRSAKPLAGVIQHGSPEARAAAARAIQRLGPDGKDAVKALAETVKDAYKRHVPAEVVIAAADALAEIGPRAGSAHGTLKKERERNPDPEVREALARAMVKIKP